MDKFVENTGAAARSRCTPASIVMDYYDGNTRHRAVEPRPALRDERQLTSASTFGPSTIGAINLVSGQHARRRRRRAASGVENGTMIGDSAAARSTTARPGAACRRCSGKNIGDLLNAAGVTWGWFAGRLQADR